MFNIPGHGLVFDTHDLGRQEVLDLARGHLLAGGMPPFDADTIVASALVGQAWWGGPEVGFVGEEYPGALPVTVVSLP